MLILAILLTAAAALAQTAESEFRARCSLPQIARFDADPGSDSAAIRLCPDEFHENGVAAVGIKLQERRRIVHVDDYNFDRAVTIEVSGGTATAKSNNTGNVLPIRTVANNGHLERLIIDMKESLERELVGVRDSLREDMRQGFSQVNDRLDRMEARSDRHGGLLRTGQTNLVRLNDWSERIDLLLAARDKRLDDLEARLKRLESAQNDNRSAD
jgi:hypothetical protein